MFLYILFVLLSLIWFSAPWVSEDDGMYGLWEFDSVLIKRTHSDFWTTFLCKTNLQHIYCSVNEMLKIARIPQIPINYMVAYKERPSLKPLFDKKQPRQTNLYSMIGLLVCWWLKHGGLYIIIMILFEHFRNYIVLFQ